MDGVNKQVQPGVLSAACQFRQIISTLLVPLEYAKSRENLDSYMDLTLRLSTFPRLPCSLHCRAHRPHGMERNSGLSDFLKQRYQAQAQARDPLSPLSPPHSVFPSPTHSAFLFPSHSRILRLSFYVMLCHSQPFLIIPPYFALIPFHVAPWILSQNTRTYSLSPLFLSPSLVSLALSLSLWSLLEFLSHQARGSPEPGLHPNRAPAAGA